MASFVSTVLTLIFVVRLSNASGNLFSHVNKISFVLGLAMNDL